MTATSYYAEISCRAIDTTRKRFQRAVKTIVAELDQLEDGKGARLTVAASEQTITFGFVFETDEYMDALQKASHVARTALHASGGSTPNWPSFRTIEVSATDSREVESELVNA